MTYLNLVLTIILSTISAGCFDGPGFFTQNGVASSSLEMKSTTSTDGVTSAKFNPGLKQTQKINASGAIAGSSVAFPPGSLAISTDISVEPGADIAGNGVITELGLNSGAEISAASSAVVVQSSVSTNASQPFSLNIPVGSTGLALAGAKVLIVVYKVIDAATGEVLIGVIPSGELVVENGVATFKTTMFGSFQLAYTNIEIKERKQKPAKEKTILTKKKEATLPSISWNTPEFSVNLDTREISFSASFTSSNITMSSCGLFVDEDKLSPWDFSFDLGSGTEHKFQPTNNEEHKLVARIECTDSHGRMTGIAWTSPINIPGVAKAEKLAIAVDAPSQVVSMGNIGVTVKILTNKGEVDSSFTGLVSANLVGVAGASLHGVMQIPAAAGIATFDSLAIDKAGTAQRIAFSADGLAGVSTGDIEVTTGPASQLSFSTQPSDLVLDLYGMAPPMSVSVAVVDEGGNIVTTGNPVSINLDWDNDLGGMASASFPLTVNSAAGVAIFSSISVSYYGYEGQGGLTFKATSPGLEQTISAPFAVQKLCEAYADATSYDAVSGVDGTVSNPYVICNYAMLQSIPTPSTNVYYVLGADIRGYESTTSFTPIGNSGSSFQGFFDGNGYWMMNMRLQHSGSDYVGVFGFWEPPANGYIKNVYLENVEVEGANYTGGLIGKVGGTSTASIEEVAVTGRVSGSYHVGGAVGQITNSNVSMNGVYFKGRVVGSGDNIGGLVGQNEANISHSYVQGSVQGSSNVGGGIGLIPGGAITLTSLTSFAEVAGSLNGVVVGTDSGSTSYSSVKFYDRPGTSPQCTGSGPKSGCDGVLYQKYFFDPSQPAVSSLLSGAFFYQFPEDGSMPELADLYHEDADASFAPYFREGMKVSYGDISNFNFRGYCDTIGTLKLTVAGSSGGSLDFYPSCSSGLWNTNADLSTLTGTSVTATIGEMSMPAADSIVLALDLVPACATVTTGAPPFEAGDGSPGNPYIICSVDQLAAIDTHCVSNFDKHYMLGSNIKFSGPAGAGFPIGCSGAGFRGLFDGGGFTIYKYDRQLAPASEIVGLFGKLGTGTHGGVVKNLNMIDGLVKSDGKAGLIAGELVNGGLEHVFAHGEVIANGSYAGGLIGYVSASGAATNGSTLPDTLKQAGFMGWVSAFSYAGGLVGKSAWAVVRESFSKASIVSVSQAGGLLGAHFGGANSLYFNNFYADSAIFGTNLTPPGTNDFGGIVGQLPADGSGMYFVNGYSDNRNFVNGYFGMITGLGASAPVEGYSNVWADPQLHDYSAPIVLRNPNSAVQEPPGTDRWDGNSNKASLSNYTIPINNNGNSFSPSIWEAAPCSYSYCEDHPRLIWFGGY